MDFFSKITAFFISVACFILAPYFSIIPSMNDYTFSVDTASAEKELPNAVSNVNVWEMGTQFINPEANTENNIFDFVEYVQLMQCTGGSKERDLFKDPLDFDTLDDYDFTKLIENCRGILSLGAKPHLKTGSVPLKYSALARTDTTFGTNPYPPDDYDVYYDYIYAIGEALVNEFGKEEVLSWRFGVMTEYENKDWFFAPDEAPESSAVAFCKLYDYTVDALQKSIGEEIFVGAHSMTVTEGLWDEEIFINHCANGTNYKTGQKGSRIKFLSSSFYDVKPGEFTSGKTIEECFEYLKACADRAGLENLIFGIDEGRILTGTASGTIGSELLSRTVGYTYQAAYDARAYKQMFSAGGDYFSSWYYLSDGLLEGNPTVSYHIARNVSKFKGMNETETKLSKKGLLLQSEIDCFSAVDAENGSILLMAYNFKNDINYKNDADIKLEINAPHLNGKQVEITVYKIDDSCNYFDEWCEDRVKYGIGDECFAWSPDDPCIDNPTTLSDNNARNIYFSELKEKYRDCSVLTPVTVEAQVYKSTLTLSESIAPNGVVFIEINPV